MAQGKVLGLNSLDHLYIGHQIDLAQRRVASHINHLKLQLSLKMVEEQQKVLEVGSLKKKWI